MKYLILILVSFLLISSVLAEEKPKQICLYENELFQFCQTACTQGNAKWEGQLIFDMVKRTIQCICYKEKKK